ncbi:MAG: hypothetical protein EH225_10795, partial [Calditrichaeota bacterium]
MSEIKISYQKIYKNLVRTHRKYFAVKIMKSTLVFGLFASGFLIVWLGINLLFDVSSVTRFVFFLLLLLGLFFYTLIRILPDLREIFSPSDQELFRTAKRAGNMDESIQDAVLNYIQLYNNRSSAGSEAIRKKALQQLSLRISSFSLREYSTARTAIPYLRWITLPLSVFIILWILIPDSVELATKKLLLPWRNYIQPFPLTLINESGDMEVLKNDPVTLICSSQGMKPDNLFLVIEDLGQDYSNRKNTSIEIPLPTSNRYEYELAHVSNSFSYYFSAELNQTRYRHKKALSGISVVKVVERPVIRTLQVNVIPPSYSGLDASSMAPNDGEITAYPGSTIRLSIEADRQLSQAYLVFADSSQIPISVAGHTGKASFTPGENTSYSIRIFDTDSIGNDNPVTYGIYLLNDEFPFAEIKQPGADVDLGDELMVPMLISIRDDFGFTGLWLRGSVFRQGYSKDSTSFELKIPFESFEKGKALSDFTWDVTSFYLVPDDYIQYYAEVSDNDRINGPKWYRTQSYTIRLPSLLEILARSEEKQLDQLERIDEISEESRQLKEKLEEINRELKKESEVNWERQQEIKKQMEKQTDISEKLSDIQQKIDEVVKELSENEVLSPEALQKYMELQEMFQELAPEELKQAMNDLQQALEKADFNQIRKSLEKFEMSVKEFEENIKRFHELFKRVQLEQKMDELIKLAEKLNQEQTEINEQLIESAMPEENFPKLEMKEENIGKNAEFLAKEMGKAGLNYQEVMKEMSRMLEEARNYMNEQELQQRIQEMQQQLGKLSRQEASKSGQELKSSFEMLQAMLQMAKNDMMNQQKQQISEAMQKTMQDMLSTSFDQENLAGRSRQLSPASPQINDVARQQSRLMSSTNQLIQQLIDISRQTFMLSPELNKHMAEAFRNMNQSVQKLEERNPRQAHNHQMQAMAGFNKGLMTLQNSMNQLSQSNSPSGFQEFMEQLQKMSGQQGALNQESMSLFQQQGGGRPQLSEDALARLAAQQEMIRKSLQQA